MDYNEFKSPSTLKKEKIISTVFKGNTAAVVAMVLSIISIVLFAIYALIYNIKYFGNIGWQLILDYLPIVAMFVCVIVFAVFTMKNHNSIIYTGKKNTTYEPASLILTILITVFSASIFISSVNSNYYILLNLLVFIPVGIVAMLAYIKDRKLIKEEKTRLILNDGKEFSDTIVKNNYLVSFAWGVVAVALTLGLFGLKIIPHVGGVIYLAVYFPLIVYSNVFGWKKGMVCAVVIIAICSFSLALTRIRFFPEYFLAVPLTAMFKYKTKFKASRIILGAVIVTLVHLLASQLYNINYYIAQIQNSGSIDGSFLLRAILTLLIAMIVSTGLALIILCVPALGKYAKKIEDTYLNGPDGEVLNPMAEYYNTFTSSPQPAQNGYGQPMNNGYVPSVNIGCTPPNGYDPSMNKDCLSDLVVDEHAAANNNITDAAAGNKANVDVKKGEVASGSDVKKDDVPSGGNVDF